MNSEQLKKGQDLEKAINICKEQIRNLNYIIDEKAKDEAKHPDKQYTGLRMYRTFCNNTYMNEIVNIPYRALDTILLVTKASLEADLLELEKQFREL